MYPSHATATAAESALCSLQRQSSRGLARDEERAVREALFAAAAPRPAGLQRPELPASERECDARLAQSAGRETKMRACGTRTVPLGMRLERAHSSENVIVDSRRQREFERERPFGC